MTMNMDMNGSASVSRQASLARGPTATQKLRQVQRNVLRPLRIAHNSAGLPYMLDTSSITLPFRLNVAEVHDKTRRNVSYL